jgi:hypothetical protein
MTALQKEFGAAVILLTYHVDYWDSLGWKDTFSEPFATQRQKEYGRLFNQDSIYTPEMVIHGEIGFVGSDLAVARKEVEARISRPGQGFSLTLTAVSPTQARLSIQLPKNLVAIAHEAMAVIYENAPSVRVLRGENRGEEMTGAFAVRQLVAIPIVLDQSSSVTLTRQAAWEPHHLGVALLLRKRNDSFIGAENVAWPLNTVN